MYFSPFRTVYKRSQYSTVQYSVLSSVQGTQGMITAWIFATTVAGFLGFGMILLPYSQVQYTVYDIFYALSTL
jgi:hypothetical protein